MLNLTQTKLAVKQVATALVPNPNHPMGMGLAYRLLKQHGWVCHDPNDKQGQEMHPTERVPIFRLGQAAIRRNKTGNSHWIIEVDGSSFETDDDVATITEAVQAKLAAMAKPAEAEPLPSALSPAQRIAAEIEAEAPHLGKRVAKGLAYFEAGQVEFPKYRTRYDYGNGGKVIRECDCQDAYHRGFRADFGRACAHTIAQEIAYRLTREFNAIKNRRIADRQERRSYGETRTVAEQKAAASASLGSALRPDPLNRQRGHYNDHGRWIAAGS